MENVVVEPESLMPQDSAGKKTQRPKVKANNPVCDSRSEEM